MNVTETKSEGLSREFKVSVPKGDLAAKLTAKIEEVRPQVRLKGFRPGKVPASHIKKMFGRSLMGEIVDDVLRETSSKALEDNSLRPASQPSIKLDSDAESVVTGESDLEYSMEVEVMPEFEPADITVIELERLTAEPSEDEINESLTKIAESNKAYDAKEEGAAAENGDAVVIDFVGKIDDEAFEGGSAEGHTLVLGEGRFIGGFEEQLVGAKAGDKVEVKVTFPEDYPAEHLKGKPAVFDVTVHEVKAPRTPDVDDEFAKSLGLEGLDALKDAVKQQLSGDLDFAARQVVKRRLLDALDALHTFDLPPKMVEAEFNQIWAQLEEEKKADRMSDEDKAKSEDELRAEYRKIAERRVRLGLVLAEIGRAADVQISNDELARALRQEAQRFPGQEQAVIDFYSKRPDALAQLRAPIFEEKVVDHILERAKVTDKSVTREELMAAAEAE
ncbi:MAG: trigger factor [Hyphomonadaceae bacterium]